MTMTQSPLFARFTAIVRVIMTDGTWSEQRVSVSGQRAREDWNGSLDSYVRHCATEQGANDALRDTGRVDADGYRHGPDFVDAQVVRYVRDSERHAVVCCDTFDRLAFDNACDARDAMRALDAEYGAGSSAVVDRLTGGVGYLDRMTDNLRPASAGDDVDWALVQAEVSV